MFDVGAAGPDLKSSQRDAHAYQAVEKATTAQIPAIATTTKRSRDSVYFVSKSFKASMCTSRLQQVSKERNAACPVGQGDLLCVC